MSGDQCASERCLGGATLDVFSNVPSVDPGFAKLGIVVLQLHRSSATVETRTAAAGPVRNNLQKSFNGEPLLTGYTD
jgi:lactate dehydrogenase-like 2-hydroxyacid dehydrogenase